MPEPVSIWLLFLHMSRSQRPRVDAVKGVIMGLRELGDEGSAARAAGIVDEFIRNGNPVEIAQAATEEAADRVISTILSSSAGVVIAGTDPLQVPKIQAEAEEQEKPGAPRPHRLIYTLLTLLDGNPIMALAAATAFAREGLTVFEDVQKELIDAYGIDRTAIQASTST